MLIHLYRRHPEDHVVFAGFQRNGNCYRVPCQPEQLRNYGDTAEQIAANLLFQERCQEVARKLELQTQLEHQAIKTGILILPEGLGSIPRVKAQITKVNFKRIEWKYMCFGAKKASWKSTGTGWDTKTYVDAVSLSSPDGLSADGKNLVLQISVTDSGNEVQPQEAEVVKREKFMASLPIEPHGEDEACFVLKGQRPAPDLSFVPVESTRWEVFPAIPTH